MREKIADAFRALHEYLEARGYRGYEFDDLLSSPLVAFVTGRSQLLQRIAIQAGRRSIVNIRSLLGVKKLLSSKAFGFFARGYLYRYLASREEAYLSLAKQQLEWLESNYCREYSGMSWGNAFDFASRGGFIPRGTPTIVWTSLIAETFDLAYAITQVESYKNAVVMAAVFIVNNLKRQEDNSGICLGYEPSSLSVIHNSNLLGAVTLLRAWKHTRDDAYLALAKKAISWSCSRINPDGSWYYGAHKKYYWIDNFHTAYNLDSLVAAQELAGDRVVNQNIIDATYSFWTRKFFLNDGRPKYYPDALYPVDIQCASQAIESLAKYSNREPDAINLAMKVANWTLANMQKSNGAFRLRRGRVLKNGLESIHWGQATMLSALGCLLMQLEAMEVEAGLGER
jgi:hypothetical protein